jgi:uncharacterized delta-60 repeat protein
MYHFKFQLYTIMRNVYKSCFWLPLSVFSFCFFLSNLPAHAQVLNDGFIPPTVYRQAQTSVIKVTSGDYQYVAGDFDFHGDRPVSGHLVRLKPDGTLDTSFSPESPDATISAIVDLEVLANNRVVYIGSTISGDPHVVVVLGPDGQHLKTIRDMDAAAVEPDGQGGFFLGGSEGLINYYNPNLELERTVTHVNNIITDIQRQNEYIIVSGGFGMVWDAVEKTYYPRRLVARFLRNGQLSKTFNADAAMESHDIVGGIVLQSDGKVVPVRKYIQITENADEHPGGMRLNMDGSRDTNFSSPFPASVPFDDAFLTFGNLTVVANSRIVRLHHNGSINQAFAAIPFPQAQLVVGGMSDGSLVAGNYLPATYGIARFSSLGTRVNDYYARLTRYGEIYSIDRTSSSIWIGGDFVRVGNHFTRNVARLNLDGTVLTKFTSSIITPVHTVEGLDNARALAHSANRLYRFEHNGNIDPLFVYASIPELTSITKFVVQPDGKILVGGNLRLFRLNANGSRDYSFDGDVGKDAVNGASMDFDLDRTTGKILYTNWQYNDGINYKKELFRLNPDGSRDDSFNPPAFDNNNFRSYTQVLVLDNQEVLLMKPAYLDNQDRSYDIVKLNADGSQNEEFTNNFNGEYSGYVSATRFGDRIIVYGGAILTYDAIMLDGTPDPLFEIPVLLAKTPRLYSDNGTELFVAGDIRKNGRSYQIVKLTYPATAATANMAGVEERRLHFYPNPVAEKLTVDVKSASTVSILDGTGHNLLSVPVDETTNTIDVQQLRPGRYIIEIKTERKTYREHLTKH